MMPGPGRLYRERRGNAPERWVLCWRDSSGKRRRQVLSTDKRVAQRMHADLIRQRDLELAGLGAVEGQSRPLTEIVDMYVEDLSLRTCPRHYEQAARRLGRVVTALQAPRVRDVKPYAVSRVRAARVAEGVSHRTANLEVDTLKSCLQWAVKMGLVAENPLRNMPRLPETKAHKKCVRRALTDDEIQRFIAAAEADDAEQAARLGAVRTIANGSKGVQWALRSRRHRIPQAPLWMAFLETGARYGELTSTTWFDVDFERRALTLRPETTKSGRERCIPLRDELVRALLALREVHTQIFGGVGERVFLTPDGARWPAPTTNAMRTFDRLLAAAGISRVDEHGRKVDIHALRHSFCSRLARSGVGLAHAQKLMGHADPKLTAQAYTHLDTDDLRAAIESMHTGHVGRRTP